MARKLTPAGTVVWTHTLVLPGESTAAEGIFAAAGGDAVAGGYFGPIGRTEALTARRSW